MLIHEVIIENFMSYKYSRIPFNSGLNIICGPNGSGKSSILLALSVAMGQAYTERGRKLSDLIRWGEDTARVTIVFDNQPRGGVRPIKRYDVDLFRLSRYLNTDGNYWYEANFQAVNKGQVTEILRELGMNPDNMLIIMHQHMMMEFSIISSQRKLIMVEEAVGLGKYRENVLEAQENLERVLSEEESVSTLLRNAEQTLDYWKNEYDRYQRRKELLVKKSFLERELAWARMIRKERAVESCKERLKEGRGAWAEKGVEMEETEAIVEEFQERLKKIRYDRDELYRTLMELEREENGLDEDVQSLRDSLEDVEAYYQEVTEGLGLPHKWPETSGTRDPLNLVRGDDHTILVNGEEDDSEDPEPHRNVEKRISELRTQVKLLKQEADKLTEEESLLDELLEDKSEREKELQKKRERLEGLSVIEDQIRSGLEGLESISRRRVLEETRMEGLVKELDGIINRLPSTINVQRGEEPVQTAETVLEALRSYTEAVDRLEESIYTNEEAIRSLKSEEQRLVTSIQVCQNEIEKLKEQKIEVNLSLEGERDDPQIRCDKCGSLLTQDQWLKRLKSIEEDLEKSGSRLYALRGELEGITERLSEKRREQDRLHQDERALKSIPPTCTRVKVLKQDLEDSIQALENHGAGRGRIQYTLSEALKMSEENDNPTPRVEYEAREHLAEVRGLRVEVPRLEADLSKFVELNVEAQRKRFEDAKRASEEYRRQLPKIVDEFRLYVSSINSSLKSLENEKTVLRGRISDIQVDLDEVEERFNSLTERYQDAASKKALLSFQRTEMEREISELEEEYENAERELAEIQPIAEESGARVETERAPADISSDIKVTKAHLSLLKDVSEDVEKMYKAYLNQFRELKEKAILVTENREQAMEEVEERKSVWKKLLNSLLDDVNPIFNEFLEEMQGTGRVLLVNTEEMEETGLELLVGFKGAEPHVLDSQTQSGGEKSSATMAFLLALQNHIKSPLRAVDEFDVHMDPRNRELVSQMLLKEMERDFDSQYLVITPGQLTNVGEDVHVITVQRVKDTSEITVTTPTTQAG